MELNRVLDPREVPVNPEVSIDTTNPNVDEAIERILLKLEHKGRVR